MFKKLLPFAFIFTPLTLSNSALASQKCYNAALDAMTKELGDYSYCMSDFHFDAEESASQNKIVYFAQTSCWVYDEYLILLDEKNCEVEEIDMIYSEMLGIGIE